MSRFMGRLAVSFMVLVVATVVVFVIGMRTKSPTVQRAVRQMNKRFWNPRAMRTAGTPGAYASVVHHVGRRSGATHSTPVVPVETDDGFVIALPYGTRTDWVQNVLAAGAATLVHAGEIYELSDPEIVPTAPFDALFTPSDRQAQRALDVDTCLQLRRARSTAD